MRSILLPALAVLTAGAVLAQDAPQGGNNNPAAGGRRNNAGGPGGAGGPGAGGAGMGARMIGGGDTLDMLTRMLQNPAAMQTALGLTEEQIATLRPLLAEVDAKIRVIDANIQQLGLEQANVFAKTLAAKDGEAEKELIGLTDKIGEANVERARLRIQRLLVLKEVLTAEQIAKAAELVKANAARQVELDKAIAEGDWATVQRLRTEMQQQFGIPGGGPGAGFNRQGGQGGQQGQGRQGGGQGQGQGRQGGGQGQGRQGGGRQGGGNNAGGNNAGGNNNAPAPAPAGWN